MGKMTRTTRIDATPEEVFEQLTKPASTLVIKPDTMDIQDVQGEEPGERSYLHRNKVKRGAYSATAYKSE